MYVYLYKTVINQGFCDSNRNMIYLHSHFLAYWYDILSTIDIDFVKKGPVVAQGGWGCTVEDTVHAFKCRLQILGEIIEEIDLYHMTGVNKQDKWCFD